MAQNCKKYMYFNQMWVPAKYLKISFYNMLPSNKRPRFSLFKRPGSSLGRIRYLVCSKFQDFKLVSVAEQGGLGLTWSQTPEDRFSHNVAHIVSPFQQQSCDMGICKTLNFTKCSRVFYII